MWPEDSEITRTQLDMGRNPVRGRQVEAPAIGWGWLAGHFAADDMEVLDIMNYHIWNMLYHEGQINYIASLLELPQETP